ncbi:hypothetical protein [Thalassolituus sp. UBA3500]|uniref:hypothetical protein n=1 Tax=Thalassolituus sp. UBA3500 TaxID=1947664 RepID=UPI000C117072|nr:hypothetical protein [Thalassolituus sp. UBA3500]MBN57817.1 hypothetical protein [Oceanospirillaceae bacterium]|tara:strand:+ start:7071 stop:7277 length:207 start_codon:yes stop_codon:yes gene_type:complete
MATCNICEDTGVDDRYAVGQIYCECQAGKRAWLAEMKAERALILKSLAANELQIRALEQQIERGRSHD